MGAAHAIPTRQVLAGFYPIISDNRRSHDETCDRLRRSVETAAHLGLPGGYGPLLRMAAREQPALRFTSIMREGRCR